MVQQPRYSEEHIGKKLLNTGNDTSRVPRQNFWSSKKVLAAVLSIPLALVGLAVAFPSLIHNKDEITKARDFKFAQKTKVFHRLREKDPWAVNKTWDCLPNENGLVYLDREAEGLEQYGLPSGDGKRNLYGIGWMHQTYCLALFRNSLYTLMYDDSVSDWGQFERQHSLDTVGMRAHIEDCFDYLRQKIQCAGDMTIEGAASMPHTDPLGDEYHIDGFDIANTCADGVRDLQNARCEDCY